MKRNPDQQLPALFSRMREERLETLYVRGVAADQMLRRAHAAYADRPEFRLLSVEHAYQGCILVLHENTTTAAEARRRAKQEWRDAEAARTRRQHVDGRLGKEHKSRTS